MKNIKYNDIQFFIFCSVPFFFLCSFFIHFFLFWWSLTGNSIFFRSKIFPPSLSLLLSSYLLFFFYSRSICLEYLCICILLTLRQRNIKNKIKWEENRHKLEWISRTFNNCRWWYPAAKFQSSEKNFSMY